MCVGDIYKFPVLLRCVCVWDCVLSVGYCGGACAGGCDDCAGGWDEAAAPGSRGPRGPRAPLPPLRAPAGGAIDCITIARIRLCADCNKQTDTVNTLRVFNTH